MITNSESRSIWRKRRHRVRSEVSWILNRLTDEKTQKEIKLAEDIIDNLIEFRKEEDF